MMHFAERRQMWATQFHHARSVFRWRADEVDVTTISDFKVKNIDVLLSPYYDHCHESLPLWCLPLYLLEKMVCMYRISCLKRMWPNSCNNYGGYMEIPQKYGNRSTHLFHFWKFTQRKWNQYNNIISMSSLSPRGWSPQASRNPYLHVRSALDATGGFWHHRQLVLLWLAVFRHFRLGSQAPEAAGVLTSVHTTAFETTTFCRHLCKEKKHI